MKQRVYCISYCLKKLSHPADFTSMFNVSALLLDDALKPASTPLINGAINETLRQTLDISQDNVATHLRCGGIFSDNIITNFLLILTVISF